MDQAFFIRARRMLEQRPPARLDHDTLVSAILRRQQASPTAQANVHCTTGAVAPFPGRDPASVLLSATDWPHAAGGCFNRANAARRVNTP